MKIEVKQEHINKGRRFTAVQCALALAFNEAGFERSACDSSNIHYGTEDRIVIKLPLEAREWVRQFDLGFKVEPLVIEIDVDKPAVL